jgi:energy-dependent translational throttle protein EttA
VREPEPHADAGCFEGPYSSYKEDLRRRKGVDADQPHRIAYKKLVRA